MHFAFYLGDSGRIGFNLHFKVEVKSGFSDDENYVTCQSLFVCQHSLVFSNCSQINHGPLNFWLAKFKSLRYSYQVSKCFQSINSSKCFAFPLIQRHNFIFACTTTKTF